MLIVALGYFYVIVVVGVVCLMTGHAGMGIFLLLFCGFLPLSILIFINRRKRERWRARQASGGSEDHAASAPSPSYADSAAVIDGSSGAALAHADHRTDAPDRGHHHHLTPDHHGSHGGSSAPHHHHDSHGSHSSDGGGSYDSGSSSSDSGSSSSSSD